MADEGNKTKTTPLPILKSRNPHWRIISFLRDVLNEKRDLIYFVQILFQTLPLMTCLEHLEAKCAIEGDIGKILIIPRAYDSVRVIFSAKYAIDIRFTDKTTICVSDAAYHHLFYSTCTKTTDNTADTFIAPQPYLVQQQTINTENNLKPIKVAQQFKFMPFDQFSGLLDSLDTWLFSMEESTKQMEATDELFLNQKTEPSALSLQHGLLCSASLCQGILYKLQAMV
ncbi:uncharacterized protein BX663DRAFT_9648 [Cokeromyces recurvatus]|uniref:uncharacterized protein n=1 Tax=Cokeromyces recurvatus TaxID=90255 RepID=UPI002220E946|nr:uncharacterized protein BX663DRAFT_9648 [Cokeromyces recurvatus]KAI7907734.1 hypothetical protein BX663DRAFT_9648 [Cokeromyces recurvatus]